VVKQDITLAPKHQAQQCGEEEAELVIPQAQPLHTEEEREAVYKQVLTLHIEEEQELATQQQQ
jgi:hypothetical protein